jgi:AcrR family transcriptional regulator
VTKDDKRTRDREARREAILAAAEPMLLERGYGGLVMDEVATGARMSKGTVYLYFENKDALCAAISARHIRDILLPDMQRRFAKASDALERISEAVKAYVEFFLARPEVFRYTLAWMLEEAPAQIDSDDFAEYQANLAQILAFGIDNIKAGQADGIVRDDVPAALLAHDMWASVVGLTVSMLTERAVRERMPSNPTPEALMTFHLKRTIDGLKPRPAEAKRGR